MSELFDIRDVGIWLFLIALGVILLIWLVVNLLRVDVASAGLVEPLMDVEPVMLEQFECYAEPPSDVCSPPGRSLAVGQVAYEEPGAQTHLPEPPRSVPDVRGFIELADKMQQLAELTALVLEKRQVLAGATIDPQLAEDNFKAGRSYLSFVLDRERFAVGTMNVHVIVEGTQLNNKPTTRSKQRRAIRLGNTLVPVIDLGIYFGVRPVKMSWSTCVIILEVGGVDQVQMIGVIVDAVGGMLRVIPSQIEQPEFHNNKVRNDFIVGTASVNSDTIILLDIERGLLANEFFLPRSLNQPLARESVPT